MRTTIAISDGLLARAKRYAEQHRMTLSAVVEESLRDRLLRPAGAGKGAEPFRLVTFGTGGLRPGYSFDRLKNVEAEEDMERVLGRSRGRASRANEGDDSGFNR